MQSLTYGIIPDDLTIDEPYRMELNAADEAIVCSIINQGIDSHLEAVHATDKGIIESNIHLSGNKHAIEIEDSASMRCFLRRCMEAENCSGDCEEGDCNCEGPHDLASCIMTTLGYEWI
jgi:hypothetical protein